MTPDDVKPGRCQEASMVSGATYIPCGRPAARMIQTRDTEPYRMCEACADHNVKNRGAMDIGLYEGPAPGPSLAQLQNEIVPDYSQYEADASAPVDSGDLLAQITRAVRELSQEQAAVEEAQALLKARQDRVRQLEEFRIPELMREAGQTMLRTVDGDTVELTEKLNASISAVNLFAAVKWLEEHGQGAIVKRDLRLQFGKGEDEKADRALALILEAGFTPEDKQSVHPQTLGAAIREMLAEGVDVPMELLGAHIRAFAKVKPPKN